MSVRDPRSHGVRAAVESRSRSISRHDLLLAAIPTLVLLGFLLGHVGALPVAGGAALGSGMAATLVGYALFVETPGERPSVPGNGGR